MMVPTSGLATGELVEYLQDHTVSDEPPRRLISCSFFQTFRASGVGPWGLYFNGHPQYMLMFWKVYETLMLVPLVP